MRLSAAVVRNSINELDADEIEQVFQQFDQDKSGDLDTFELSAAIKALLGKAPSTGQMIAIVSKYVALGEGGV